MAVSWYGEGYVISEKVRKGQFLNVDMEKAAFVQMFDVVCKGQLWVSFTPRLVTVGCLEGEGDGGYG